MKIVADNAFIFTDDNLLPHCFSQSTFQLLHPKVSYLTELYKIIIGIGNGIALTSTIMLIFSSTLTASEAEAAQNCPAVFQDAFWYYVNVSGAITCNTQTELWDGCSDVKTMTFNYTQCSTPVAYSSMLIIILLTFC